MRLTIELAIDAAGVDDLYGMYAAAFGPMRTRAAARHLLTAAEFTAEMGDKRIEKYVVWSDDDEPLGLATVTTDLSAVAWISPDFYAARYPQHAARGALLYLGYLLVRPGRGTYRVGRLLLDRIVERLVAQRAVCVFDVASFNDRRAVGRFVSGLPRAHGARVEAVDVQTYYGVTFGEPEGGDA